VEGLQAFLAGLSMDESPRGKEQALRSVLMSVNAELVRDVLERAEPDLRERLRQQGHRDGGGHLCQGALKSKGFKTTELLFLFGPVQVRQWTAICRVCHRRIGALDELLGEVNEMTADAAATVAEASVVLAYEPARKHLQGLQGLEVDDNRIHRTVSLLGPAAQRAQEQAPRLMGRERPPKGARVYILVDGGRCRSREPGRPWREPVLGLVMWEGRDGKLIKRGISHPSDKTRVLSVLERYIRRFLPSREVVILSDGAEWIQNWADQFPEAIRILDYYHVKEHVWKAANELHGEGTPQAARWADHILNRLWRGWVPSTVAELDRMKPRGLDRDRKRKALDELATYLENHSGLIRFGQHRNAGRFIGSGAIESLCKQVFTMRIKGPGMFWSEEGAGNVMALRTAYVTGHLDSVFDRRVAA